MAFITRPLDWEDTDEIGYPVDCLDIKEYFNKAIGRELYPYIPRKEKITYDEIRNIWVPGRYRNSSFVASIGEGKVIAAATALNNPDNGMSKFTITKDPCCKVEGIGRALIATTIDDALSNGFTVHVHSSVENEAMTSAMISLGYAKFEQVPDFYKGKVNASSQDAYHWIIGDNRKIIRF